MFFYGKNHNVWKQFVCPSIDFFKVTDTTHKSWYKLSVFFFNIKSQLASAELSEDLIKLCLC